MSTQLTHRLDDRLVFIIASPRSGTNWLQRMIATSSSKVVTGPESYLMRNYIAPQIKSWNNDKIFKSGLSLCLIEKEFLKNLKNYAADLFQTIAGDLKPNQFYLDKTSSNALIIKEVKKLFPNSKIIHVIRDPRDVIASLHDARKTWASYHDDPDSTAFYIKLWKQSVDNAKEVKNASSPGKFIEIRYENLLKNTQQELKKVLTFLNIEISDKKINRVVKNHSFKNISQGKGYKLTLRGEVGGEKGKIWQEPKGFFRKGKIGSWKKDLNLIQKIHIKLSLQKIMFKHGYEW